jgi:hypothetical protein
VNVNAESAIARITNPPRIIHGRVRFEPGALEFLDVIYSWGKYPNESFGFGRRDGKGILLCRFPLITLIDKHHRDIFHDWVFPIAIFTDQPGFLIEFQQTVSLADTGRAA